MLKRTKNKVSSTETDDFVLKSVKNKISSTETDDFVLKKGRSMKEGKNLVIVESPAKAGTIQKFLGKDFVVKSSFGHIRDLQENGLSIDIKDGFKPEYVIPADKKKVVAELKKSARESETVWLASDEDREGEAISWHLFETLDLRKENTKRIVFHEITRPAILNAIENPREIDMSLVDAQQARRVLDRLVGFELSPVLWRKVQPKLSAGRLSFHTFNIKANVMIAFFVRIIIPCRKHVSLPEIHRGCARKMSNIRIARSVNDGF